ncbi:TPA: hypothetical protein N0F65_009716 [Lagenidium giganteum]|uniref:Uncharacterized protein n=1 Tax=Lagenidium giganteum TaxID=4803 RepID=A0AAV2YDK6_9STRA|nr:TPA: hypothetical protein N0F65_009716 [Lagenidium giganteum]
MITKCIVLLPVLGKMDVATIAKHRIGEVLLSEEEETMLKILRVDLDRLNEVTMPLQDQSLTLHGVRKILYRTPQLFPRLRGRLSLSAEIMKTHAVE